MIPRNKKLPQIKLWEDVIDYTEDAGDVKWDDFDPYLDDVEDNLIWDEEDDLEEI